MVKHKLHSNLQQIVCASSSPGKLQEFNQLFQQFPLQFISQAGFQIEDAEETATTFLENALIKARHAAKGTRLPALADDSGLCVPALGGRPGVYSARFSGERNDARNNQKLLAEMQNLTSLARQAYFCCTLVFIEHEHDPMPLIFQGIWQGEILTAPCGEAGFGYDPLFYIPILQKTAAELPLAVKNQFSHRAKAVAKMLHYWKEER